MHPFAALKIVESIQRRMRQGDCPTEPPVSREALEETVLELYRQNLALRIAADPDEEPTAGAVEPPEFPEQHSPEHHE